MNFSVFLELNYLLVLNKLLGENYLGLRNTV